MKCNICSGEMTLAPDSYYICLYCIEEDIEEVRALTTKEIKKLTAEPSLLIKFNRWKDMQEDE
jgi:hypothetical protein